MRLSLNYQSEISEVITEGATDDTIIFRILGNVPMRSVLETALSIPSDIGQLDLDRQAEVFKDRLRSQMGISSLQELKDPEMVDKMITRYQAIDGINQTSATLSSASTALTLLSNAAGFGAVASQNLFLSSF